MLHFNNYKAFTFTELIVSITIIAILSTIGFYSFSSNISTTRDTQRTSDIASVQTALKLYKQKRWLYPKPWDSFDISNGANMVAMQWQLNKRVSLSTLDDIPLDPFIKIPYTYSVTKNRSEYQLAATLENDEKPLAFLIGDYKSVSKSILPTITLASWTWTDISTDQNLFIFNKSEHNLPYTLDWDYEPYSDGTNSGTLLTEAEKNDFWQNTDYTSCREIYDAWKSIWDVEYQILSWSALTNSGCTMSSY